MFVPTQAKQIVAATMFNTDYFTNQHSDPYESIHSKKSSLFSASHPVAFDFSPPIHCPALAAPDLTQLRTINWTWLEFEKPRKYQSRCRLAASAPPQLVAKHKVIVDQSPFSALKSLKSQESNTTVRALASQSNLATSRVYYSLSVFEQTTNVQVISSLRNHPYNNSKTRPATSAEQPSLPDPAITTKSRQADSPVQPCDNRPALSRNDTEILGGEEQLPVVAKSHRPHTDSASDTHAKRNSSSNAILAHLRSISPNFKSIFVRPRNLKPVGK